MSARGNERSGARGGGSREVARDVETRESLRLLDLVGGVLEEEAAAVHEIADDRKGVDADNLYVCGEAE